MPVMKSTIMSEFMMLNQWMSSSLPVLRYASQRLAQATSLFCHSTSYVKTTSVPGLSTASGSSSRLTGRCALHVFMLPAQGRERERASGRAGAAGERSAGSERAFVSGAFAKEAVSDLGDDSARHGGARAKCFCRPVGCRALLMSRPPGRAPGGSVYGARGACAGRVRGTERVRTHACTREAAACAHALTRGTTSRSHARARARAHVAATRPRSRPWPRPPWRA